VIDNTTGLEWQDDTDSIRKPWLTQANYNKCTGKGGETQDTTKCNDTSGETAATYCSNLKLDGKSWRLPTVNELMTLLDSRYVDPSTADELFQYINRDDYYWSSTTSARDTGYAWNVEVNFDTGSMDFRNKSDSYYYVRCVRGEKLVNSNFTRNATTKIVTDNTTGLQWQDNRGVKEDYDTTWERAINRCEDLSLGGYCDWRLPNINELNSIVDHSRYYFAWNNVFRYYNLDKHYNGYWSSTTRAGVKKFAWYVGSLSGKLNRFTKYTDFSVRCVRGGETRFSSPVNPSIIMYLLN